MIAYAFRFLNDEDKPTGWYGIAFAPDKRELFWQIDQHGDPYGCEIKVLNRGSCCLLQNEDDEFVDAELDTDFLVNDKPWSKPTWKKPHEK